MRLVIVESPFAGPTDLIVARNLDYARACLKNCLLRDEAPLASHLLYTQPGVLNDTKPDERYLGIRAGHEWYQVADLCAVYVDFGITSGMRDGLLMASSAGIRVEYRSLGLEWATEFSKIYEREILLDEWNLYNPPPSVNR